MGFECVDNRFVEVCDERCDKEEQSIVWDEGFWEWIGGKGIVDVMEDGLVGRRKIVFILEE